MVSEDYPLDDIIHHLWALCAPWDEIAKTLLAVNLSPAEVLQALLPLTEEGEHWAVVHVVLTEGSELDDYGDVREILKFFFLGAEDVLRTLDLDESQRERVARRLGVSA